MVIRQESIPSLEILISQPQTLTESPRWEENDSKTIQPEILHLLEILRRRGTSVDVVRQSEQMHFLFLLPG